jgi:hypothetical protein
VEGAGAKTGRQLRQGVLVGAARARAGLVGMCGAGGRVGVNIRLFCS